MFGIRHRLEQALSMRATGRKSSEAIEDLILRR